jgi:hypothetical protein
MTAASRLSSNRLLPSQNRADRRVADRRAAEIQVAAVAAVVETVATTAAEVGADAWDALHGHGWWHRPALHPQRP